MTAVCAATVLGNALVMRALHRAAPRAPAHYLLASLATADLLLGLVVQPLSAAEEMFPLRISVGVHWCECWRAAFVLSSTASILSLCALAWERREGVTRPFERASRAARARLLAMLIWPFALAVAVPAAFIKFQPHHHPGEIQHTCVLNNNIEYVILSALFSFYLPTGVALGMYWRVVQELRSLPPLRAHRGGSKEPQPSPNSSPFRFFSSIRFRSPNYASKQLNPEIYLSPKGNHLSAPWYFIGDVLSPSPSASSHYNSPLIGEDRGGGGARGASSSSGCDDSSGSSRQFRATCTIALLMTLFLVCWIPFFVILPLDTFVNSMSESAIWWATWLGYANSAVNPLVYAASSPALRRAFSASSSSTGSSEPRFIPASLRASQSPRSYT